MRAKTPDSNQKAVIINAGLDPKKWSVLKENKLYLYLVDRGIEQREHIIIDKNTGDDKTRKMP